MPSVRSPQVCQIPALTMANSSPGVSDGPNRSPPQHEIDRSSLRPQVWKRPAEMDVNGPAGKSASGTSPQQVIVLSSRSPQAW